MHLAFLVPWILAGAAIVAAPILIHLILKKKPKHLVFPAFRFLQQKQRTNLHKLRLRQLLLLALRMLLVMAIVGALARPLLTGGPSQLSADDPLAVVLVFDTSASMEYDQDGRTRLDDAKDRVGRLLDYLHVNSQVAVVDTAEPGVQFVGLRDAQQQVKNRRIRPLNRPVTASLEETFRSLEMGTPELPVVLLVLSDRTAASWPTDNVKSFLVPAKARLEERLGRPVHALYLDLGAKEPRNVAITGLTLKQGDSDVALPLEAVPYGAAPAQPQIQATLQVTGMSLDGEVTLHVDGRLADVKRVRVSAPAGQSATEVVAFIPLEFGDAADQAHQGEVRLRTVDLLPSDNMRYWTLVTTRRKVLLVADQPGDVFLLSTALQSLPQFPLTSETKTPAQVPAALHPEQYAAVCLVNVVEPSAALWESLRRYVTAGGGLVVLPGADSQADAYRTEEAMRLLPGRLTKPIDAPAGGTFLSPSDYDHPITAFFKNAERSALPGRVQRFWGIEIDKSLGRAVLPYAFEDRAALVERTFDPQRVAGRVLLFTTAAYRRNDRAWRDWNTFHENWMSLALPYLMVRHVAGGREERQNLTLRDEVRYYLPPGSGFSSYVLSGPEAAIGEIKAAQSQVGVAEARRPGNYKLTDPGGTAWKRFFSTNLPTLETDLATSRPPTEDLELLFGAGRVHDGTQVGELHELTRAAVGQSPTTELLPWLMIAVLLLLAGENFLANRFYRRVE